MVLNYVALGILVALVLLVVYGLIGIWGIPYQIAKDRNHPQQDAIGAATWVSLLTLGTLWPFLWIWAMAYRPERGCGFSGGTTPEDPTLQDLARRVSALERARAP